MTLEMLAPSVHNEGKCVHIPSHAHEGQETDTTLHQHLLFLFLRTQPREKIRSVLNSAPLDLPLSSTSTFIFYLSVTPQDSSKKSLTFSLMTASVVSAILSMTGVQSSLPVEDIRVSMAPFMMSIPEDKTQGSLSR